MVGECKERIISNFACAEGEFVLSFSFAHVGKILTPFFSCSP